MSKRFGALQAVDGLSLRLRPAEVFGLLGPNGAGKTTTLRMAVGLTRPDAGSVEIEGVGDPARAKVRARIGYAPQSLCVYDELTGRENLVLMAGLYGLRGAKLREQVDRALALVALSDRAEQRVGHYSVGMKRRLTLATAVVHRPLLLVLDEPTAGVDPQSRNAIFENIRALCREGVSVLYTTHFMEEAELLCDRVAIMDRGRVLAHGRVAELLARPPSATLALASLTSCTDGDGVPVCGGFAREPLADARAMLSEPTRARGLERLFLELTGRDLRDS